MSESACKLACAGGAMLARFRIVFRSYDLFEHNLAYIAALTPETDEARFALAALSDVERLVDYEDEFMTREQMLAKYRAGETLYLIKIKDEIAWMAWARSGLFLHVPFGCWVSLPFDIADVYGVYTKPKFRNMKLARFGYCEILSDLKRRGFSRATLQVNKNNMQSLRSVRAAGFQKYARLIYLRMAGLRLYLMLDARGKKTFHWAFRKKQSQKVNAFF
jgi:ribosomal protein S18 acetylase RimI-like enzyme